MREVADWLAGLGLEKYLEAFAAHEIDFDALRELTEDDLREIGLPVGPRRKVLASLEKLRAANVEADSTPPGAVSPPIATASPSIAVALKAPREAERRQLTVMFVDLVGSTALRYD